ncbi:nucleotide disphospho-sugar-binding domain-containing protein [Brachybacterium sp. Marseille-Q7125]|uniref:glycosyltransferase n=1 Tax=Brachybacterium sp. Marseille-Q7125 TaxID=2932815 RepID=UPI001FF43A34|nr:nucleotide disphospho-sugar-binding domain-containing protein [Brachybacterium sp. Marseille-Q7125]
MSRILFAPETFNLGETSRGVEVARVLARRGHDVLFMGYSPRFANCVRDAGFALNLLEPSLSDADADALIAVDQGRRLRHPFTTSMVRQRVDSELALIRSWRPDVIVIGTTLSIFLSARIAGVPLSYVKPFPLSRGHLAHVRALPMFAGNGRAAQMGNQLAGTLARRLAPRIRWKPSSFSRVAHEHGLDLTGPTLALLASDADLIASPFPLIDSRPLAAGEAAVGPVYSRSDAALPASLSALASRSRPCVYVGLGSSGNAGLAHRLLSQLGEMDIDVITSTGRFLDEAARCSLPDSIRIFDFLPAHRLAGLVDASIIHGGEGTVQTACASGVPFAGIGLQLEQRCNIDECVRYGNALRFTPADVRKGRLPAIVTRLLTDEVLQRRARVLRDIVNQFDGPSACADRILALARRN